MVYLVATQTQLFSQWLYLLWSSATIHNLNEYGLWPKVFISYGLEVVPDPSPLENASKPQKEIKVFFRL